jgi:hemerythrin-like domain-containing protein
MTESLLLLRLEHIQAGDLLKLIEQQLEQDDPVDLELLQSIVEYFADYPEQCHHPVEDLVFRKLQKRNSTRAAPISKILQDHKCIAEMTKRFSHTLNEAVHNENFNASKLRDIMQQFVDRYRAHIDVEEKEFFPLALKLLSKGDWAEVEYELFDRSDPLFNRKVEERFRRLREKINELGAKTCSRATAMREAKNLRQLASIRAFNEMMEKAGHDYRLSKHPEGAFCLEYQGKGVIDIPKCSPTRAAWCAYFYVEASTGHEKSV